jgi:hypothetical protein
MWQATPAIAFVLFCATVPISCKPEPPAQDPLRNMQRFRALLGKSEKAVVAELGEPTRNAAIPFTKPYMQDYDPGALGRLNDNEPNVFLDYQEMRIGFSRRGVVYVLPWQELGNLRGQPADVVLQTIGKPYSITEQDSNKNLVVSAMTEEHLQRILRSKTAKVLYYPGCVVGVDAEGKVTEVTFDRPVRRGA